MTAATIISGLLFGRFATTGGAAGGEAPPCLKDCVPL